MYLPPADRSSGEDEWRPFVEAQGFGHLVAPGQDRPAPAVQPTQFVLDGDRILLHLAAGNPLLDAIGEHPTVVMSVAGDWAYIPSDWKAIGDDDPTLGIPTTYYGAVQLTGSAEVVDDPVEVAAVLRRQLAVSQPDTPVADPAAAHAAKLRAIRAVRVTVTSVEAKFKYGGNVDDAHRAAVVEHLLARDRPGDREAASHVRRRSGSPPFANG